MLLLVQALKYAEEVLVLSMQPVLSHFVETQPNQSISVAYTFHLLFHCDVERLVIVAEGNLDFVVRAISG